MTGAVVENFFLSLAALWLCGGKNSEKRKKRRKRPLTEFSIENSILH